jgi:hypothetical protein
MTGNCAGNIMFPVPSNHFSERLGTMTYYDVVEVKITKHLEFTVKFADGASGRVKILPTHLHGVFATLADPNIFEQIRVTEGFVSWPGCVDLAPDAMYGAISRNGEWVLS